MDGTGPYSDRAGLLPTELTGMRGWILLRSPHRGRGSAPALAPTKQRPGSVFGVWCGGRVGPSHTVARGQGRWTPRT